VLDPIYFLIEGGEDEEGETNGHGLKFGQIN